MKSVNIYLRTILLSVFFSLGSQQVYAEMIHQELPIDPILSGIKIIFFTHGDNKDHDTKISILLRNGNKVYVNCRYDEDVEFSDPSMHEISLPLAASDC